MAEDWEQDDWEKEEPVVPVKAPSPAPAPVTSALAADVDMSKFADEDAELEEEKKYNVPVSQPKKKEEKKYLKEVGHVDVPLDDPIAEKLRRQRLEEQADLAAAKELFGEDRESLDMMLPKTLKEFTDFANAIAAKYVTPHKESKNYKAFLKALFKAACTPLPSAEIKDVETSLAGLRADKLKAEQAEATAKKNVKKSLNMGKAGASAGLDDYIYDDAGNGDDFDFM